MPNLSHLLPRVIALLAASFALASAAVVNPSEGAVYPDCHPCINTDNCHINDSKSSNLTRINKFPWANDFITGEKSFLTVSFVASDSRLEGPAPYMTIDNKLEKDAVIAVHYANDIAIENGQPAPLSKVALYKAKAAEKCKGVVPEDSSPAGVYRVSYDYPTSRN